MTKIKGHSFKIIVLSENLKLRNILAGKLRIEGLDVELADGGFHLLHLLERFKDNYQMIIINEDMLDMPAFEIITLIRLNKSKAQLPILFISQNGSEEEIDEMILKDANEYIVQTGNYRPIVTCALKYSELSKKKAA
jgi:DNA-binding response OmpR family regulator